MKRTLTSVLQFSIGFALVIISLSCDLFYSGFETNRNKNLADPSQPTDYQHAITFETGNTTLTERDGMMPVTATPVNLIFFEELKQGTSFSSVLNLVSCCNGDATMSYNVIAGNYVSIFLRNDPSSEALNSVFFQLEGADFFLDFAQAAPVSPGGTFKIAFQLPEKSLSGQIKAQIVAEGNAGNLSNTVTVVIMVIAAFDTGNPPATQTYTTCVTQTTVTTQTITSTTVTTETTSTTTLTTTTTGTTQTSTTTTNTTSTTFNQWRVVGTVNLSGGSAYFPEISFDPVSGEPYVVYTASSEQGKPTVMKFNGSSWTTVGVANFGVNASQHKSIAIHPVTREPYVLYSLDNGIDIRLYRFNGASWTNIIEWSIFSTPLTNGLIFHPVTNDLYASVYDLGNGSIMTQSYNGSSWTDLGDIVTEGIAPLAFLPDNTPYRAHGLGLSAHNGSSWTTVYTGPDCCDTTDMVEFGIKQSTSDPVVAYLRGPGYHFSMKKYNGATWDVLFDSTVFMSSYHRSYLKIDSVTEEPCIIHQDELKCFNGATWNTVGGSTFEIMGSDSYYETYTGYGFAFHPITNQPYIVFRDTGNGNGITVVRYGY